MIMRKVQFEQATLDRRVDCTSLAGGETVTPSVHFQQCYLKFHDLVDQQIIVKMTLNKKHLWSTLQFLLVQQVQRVFTKLFRCKKDSICKLKTAQTRLYKCIVFCNKITSLLLLTR